MLRAISPRSSRHHVGIQVWVHTLHLLGKVEKCSAQVVQRGAATIPILPSAGLAGNCRRAPSRP